MSEEKPEQRERGGLLESLDRLWNQSLRGQLERTVDEAVGRLRVPRREQVQELKRRVEVLEARIAALAEKR